MTERVAGGSAGGWVAALAAASVALLFAGSPASAARDENVACVQAFLDFSRYDVGPMDGTLSKATLAAAAAFREKAKFEAPPLAADTAATWCEAISKRPAYAALVGYSYNKGALPADGVKAKKDFDQVLVGDSKGQYVPAERNIKRPTALEFIALDGGVAAARISVNYADKGHKNDWFYNDRPGVQQRYELTEKRPFSMKPGKTYWLRLSVFVPPTLRSPERGDQLTFTDLKPMVKGMLLDAVMSLKINASAIQLNHVIGRKQECVIGLNQAGGDNTFCDYSIEQDFVEPMISASGKWLNFVYRVHWANDDTGRFHLWLNDKLVAGIAGDTLHRAEFITNKFGVYRGYYGSQGKPQPDADLYFTGIGRSETCAGLGLSNCDALEAEVATIGTPGVSRTNIIEATDMTDYLRAGGKVKK